MGTPRYMAPEQHWGETLTPAVDQYAFCVALWEALVGHAPFSGAITELVDQKAKGPPAWPAQLAVPRSIVQAINRGLSVKAEQRWPSMPDLLRALADGMVRPSRWGGIWRMSLLGALGVGSLALYSWAQARGQRCQGAFTQLEGIWDPARKIEIEAAISRTKVAYGSHLWGRLDAQLRTYAENWMELYTETCEATTIRGEQSARVMDLRMSCLRQAKGTLKSATDILVTADTQTVQTANRIFDSLALLEHCNDSEALQQRWSPHETEVIERARQSIANANAQRIAARYDVARQSIIFAQEQALNVESEPLNTEIMLADGILLFMVGNYEEATSLFQEVIDSSIRLKRWDLMVTAISNLMFILSDRRGESQRAFRYFELARAFAPDKRAESDIYGTLGMVLHDSGRLEESVVEFRRALAIALEVYEPEHFKVEILRHNLGLVLADIGRYDEALTQILAALTISVNIFGGQHPSVGVSRWDLGLFLERQGNYTEAEVELRRGLMIMEQTLNPFHFSVIAAYSDWSRVLLWLGRSMESEREYSRLLAGAIEVYGPDDLQVGRVLVDMAFALSMQGRYEDANDKLHQSMTIAQSNLKESMIGEIDYRLGRNSIALGEYTQAQEYLRAAIEQQQNVGDEELLVLKVRAARARVFLALGHHEQAVLNADLVEERLFLREFKTGLDYEERAYILFSLAMARGQTDREHARRLALRARAQYRQAGAVGHRGVGEVDHWLALNR